MKEYNYLDYNDEAIRITTVYPMAKVKPLIINGYPVMQFAYEGVLPLYDKVDIPYQEKIKHYYYLATFDSYDYKKLLLPVFDKATIVFVHYFNYKQLSDLDNRNTKYIQDAIKLIKVIRDDNWDNVWNVNMGYYDEERSHVQVYVVEQENMGDFIIYLKDNHESMKIPEHETPKLEDYEEAFIAYQKEQKKILEERGKLNRHETISIGGLDQENTNEDDINFW